ncbi:hypothetical protein [Chitinophaga sp.]|uniref:hypothetical protein n=1 Tax=Chitinophaga sp. TaxID=1869181 RepID=UPI0031E07CA5
MKSWQHLVDNGFAEDVPEELYKKMFEEMFKFFADLGLEFSNELQAKLRGHSEVIRFKKGAVILDYPEFRSHIIFAAMGLVSIELQQDGKNVPIWFLEGNGVIAPFDPPGVGAPIAERFVAAEETDCIAVHLSHIERLVKYHPVLVSIMYKLPEYQLERAARWLEGVGLTGAEKYNWFYKEFPAVWSVFRILCWLRFLGFRKGS